MKTTKIIKQMQPDSVGSLIQSISSKWWSPNVVSVAGKKYMHLPHEFILQKDTKIKQTFKDCIARGTNVHYLMCDEAG